MSKTFSSKSLSHIGSYSLVQSFTSFVLSYKFFAILATYLIALINFTQDNVIAKFPFAMDLIKFTDSKFDAVVLSNVDAIISSNYYKNIKEVFLAIKTRVDVIINSYQTKGAQIHSALITRVHSVASPYQKHASALAKNALSTLDEYRKKGEDTVSVYLKPVNEFAASTIDKVLPESKKAVDKTKSNAESELSKSIEIVSDTYERSKDLISSKSNEVTNVVISTYNKEFDSTPEKNYYVKVASASVNTGVALLKNVNSDYIQPLKETTQNYVQETITHSEEKAEELVTETQKNVENVNVQMNGSLNGTIPVVSASA